jgi:selenocysteine-specific elongation factor
VKYITLGVIGHVDHGKTSLVKALTGIDTDRLKEEKERGISITLGYSHMTLPGGEIGIIDAPGHEKFIRTMISGATGSAGVLLVVDVNEGVKPQSVEHLDIAKLLRLKRGIVVVTKCDVALPDHREFVLEEIAELVDGTFLEDAPVIHTSSVTEEGFDELRDALNGLLENTEPLPDEGFTYLPVDRVFSMSGFGTVVTGTLRRGAISVGDEMQFYPSGNKAKVRELQSHNAFVDTVLPGHRVAVNLRGTEKQELHRGDVVATPESLSPARILDAELTLLATAKDSLKNRQEIRLLFGTNEVFARAHLLDRDEVMPGDTCVLQWRIDREATVLTREPYIIRSYSPMTTIGGGIILGSSHTGYRRQDDKAVTRLEIIAAGDAKTIAEARLSEAGLGGLAVPSLCADTRLSLNEIREHLNSMNVQFINDEHVMAQTSLQDLTDRITSETELFHKEQSVLRGLTRDELEKRLPKSLPGPVLIYALETLLSAKTLAVENGLYHTTEFDPVKALKGRDRELASEIEEAFAEGGYKPPDLDEVVGRDKERHRIYRYLIDNGILIAAAITTRNKAVNRATAFHADTLQQAEDGLRERFGSGEGFTASQAKEVVDTSRKYLIPLLECLDTRGVTKRLGDERTLVSSE